MKSGREQFNKNKAIIKSIVNILDHLPKSMIKLLWNRVNKWRGKIGIGIRYCILKSRCSHCGENVFVGPDVEIINMENLSIGSNLSIHRFSYIDAIGGITIGDNVSIAHNVSLVSFDHTWKDDTNPIKYNPISKKSIEISDDVWIGCGVRILKGVTIGKRSIVAAGAVVTSDIEDNSISGGVPNKYIGNTKRK